MFTSILCPVDFSPHAERALGYAVRFAQLTHAHLTIVHVIDGLLAAAAEASGTRDTLLAQTQQEMQELLARINDGHDASERVSIALVVGEAPEEILKQATESDADLIVMGTQGLEGTRRLVFGSTTERVLRESHVPVLAVPVPETD